MCFRSEGKENFLTQREKKFWLLKENRDRIKGFSVTWRRFFFISFSVYDVVFRLSMINLFLLFVSIIPFFMMKDPYNALQEMKVFVCFSFLATAILYWYAKQWFLFPFSFEKIYSITKIIKNDRFLFSTNSGYCPKKISLAYETIERSVIPFWWRLGWDKSSIQLRCFIIVHADYSLTHWILAFFHWAMIQFFFFFSFDSFHPSRQEKLSKLENLIKKLVLHLQWSIISWRVYTPSYKKLLLGGRG